MKPWAFVFVCAQVFLDLSRPAGAQDRAPATAPPQPAIAFVNVNVIPMDRERLLAGQTVIVRGDRIVTIGATGAVILPDGATAIDGTGRYLLPGLTDAHVHLEGDGTGLGKARADFGDGPLYLAYGVTTVFNLRGTSVQLEWRRRVERGEITGPTIYTAGEFVNEPRLHTPEDVDRDVRAQARDGYDLIKFHEVFAPGVGNVTTTGLSGAAYLKMNAVAREVHIPLVGHAPVNLGLDVLLDARQPLAHVGMLSNIYFLPLASHRAWLAVSAATFGVLLAIAIATGVAILRRRGRSRVRRLVMWEVLAGLVAAVCGSLFFPGGPLYASVTSRIVFSALILLALLAAGALVIETAKMWRAPGASSRARAEGVVASSASLAFVIAAVLFWLPIAWRGSDSGIDRLAKRIHEAGIPVITTLVVYDAIGGPGRARLEQDPAIDFLGADIRTRWRRIGPVAPPWYRYTDFMKKVTGALHRAGVPLLAGTDAMGFPMVAPGSSLPRELELLVESGLTPYDAIRAATVAPAQFLGKEREFGTIAVGARADLLLLESNPLEDVTRLRRPVGVMTRGRWFTRDTLRQTLTALAQEQ